MNFEVIFSKLGIYMSEKAKANLIIIAKRHINDMSKLDEQIEKGFSNYPDYFKVYLKEAIQRTE